MIRLAVVDDHAIVRAGLKQIISECEDIVLIMEAECGEELLKQLETGRPDVLIMDIALPDLNGIELLKILKKKYPELPVLVLSIFPEEQYGIRTFREGAYGYLAKDRIPEELVKAIRSVAVKKKFITQVLAEKLADSVGCSSEQDGSNLSQKEMMYVRLLSRGFTNKQIALKMEVSIKTVYTYRQRIFEKTGLANDNELVIYAVKNLGMCDT